MERTVAYVTLITYVLTYVGCTRHPPSRWGSVGGKHSFLSFIREERVEDNSQGAESLERTVACRDIDHVCATVLSKIKILFFYLFSLLNREERDPTPLARVAGAVSAYAATYDLQSILCILP